MVEGIPGFDFAGVKEWRRLRCRVVPGPLVRIARCFIGGGVFCVLKMWRGNIVGIISRE